MELVAFVRRVGGSVPRFKSSVKKAVPKNVVSVALCETAAAPEFKGTGSSPRPRIDASLGAGMPNAMKAMILLLVVMGNFIRLSSVRESDVFCAETSGITFSLKKIGARYRA